MACHNTDWAALSSPTSAAAKLRCLPSLRSDVSHCCHGWCHHRLRSAVYPPQKVDSRGGGGRLKN
eukprot:13491551-Ditylum_brightwellii.AAC.1